MARVTKIAVPDMGDFRNVDVIEVLVKAGDVIGIDDPLISLESDKATMEVPSLQAGTVQTVAVSVGDSVSQGDVILTLTDEGTGDGWTPDAPGNDSPPSVDPANRIHGTNTGASEGGGLAVGAAIPADTNQDLPPASPAVRRLARDLAVDLREIRGTGPKCRIMGDDVEQAAASRAPQSPGESGSAPLQAPPGLIDGRTETSLGEGEFARFGPVETQPLSRIQRLSGANLQETWTRVPHATHHDKADITDLEAFRCSLGEAMDEPTDAQIPARANALINPQGKRRVTLLPFLMKAAVASLKAFPTFNASLAPGEEALIIKGYYHLGIAVDTPNGLVVPVIRHVDQKGILDLAGEIAAMGTKARAGKLTPGEMQGGCFTLSSLGGIGGTAFTPIIHAPEVAILGIARARWEPVYVDEAFQPRLLLPLSLAYDHRVIDGVAGARFMAHLCGLLSDIRRLLI